MFFSLFNFWQTWIKTKDDIIHELLSDLYHLTPFILLSLVAAIIDLSTSYNAYGDRDKQSKNKDLASIARTHSTRMMIKEQAKKLKPTVIIVCPIDCY